MASLTVIVPYLKTACVIQGLDGTRYPNTELFCKITFPGRAYAIFPMTFF